MSSVGVAAGVRLAPTAATVARYPEVVGVDVWCGGDRAVLGRGTLLIKNVTVSRSAAMALAVESPPGLLVSCTGRGGSISYCACSLEVGHAEHAWRPVDSGAEARLAIGDVLRIAQDCVFAVEAAPRPGCVSSQLPELPRGAAAEAPPPPPRASRYFDAGARSAVGGLAPVDGGAAAPSAAAPFDAARASAARRARPAAIASDAARGVRGGDGDDAPVTLLARFCEGVRSAKKASPQPPPTRSAYFSGGGGGPPGVAAAAPHLAASAPPAHAASDVIVISDGDDDNGNDGGGRCVTGAAARVLGGRIPPPPARLAVGSVAAASSAFAGQPRAWAAALQLATSPSLQRSAAVAAAFDGDDDALVFEAQGYSSDFSGLGATAAAAAAAALGVRAPITAAAAASHADDAVFELQAADADAEAAAPASRLAAPAAAALSLAPGAAADERCTVCQDALAAADTLGVVPACGHAFCYGCIAAWARITNHCCLCKAEFSELRRVRRSWPRAAGDGPAFDVLVCVERVADRRQRMPIDEAEDRALAWNVAQAGDSGDDEGGGSWGDDGGGGYNAAPDAGEDEAGEEDDDGVADGGGACACNVCHTARDADVLLLCDGCDGAWHTYCLPEPLPDVPDGRWICPPCDALRAGDAAYAALGLAQFVAVRQQQLAAERVSRAAAAAAAGIAPGPPARRAGAAAAVGRAAAAAASPPRRRGAAPPRGAAAAGGRHPADASRWVGREPPAALAERPRSGGGAQKRERGRRDANEARRRRRGGSAAFFDDGGDDWQDGSGSSSGDGSAGGDDDVYELDGFVVADDGSIGGAGDGEVIVLSDVSDESVVDMSRARARHRVRAHRNDAGGSAPPPAPAEVDDAAPRRAPPSRRRAVQMAAAAVAAHAASGRGRAPRQPPRPLTESGDGVPRSSAAAASSDGGAAGLAASSAAARVPFIAPRRTHGGSTSTAAAPAVASAPFLGAPPQRRRRVVGVVDLDDDDDDSEHNRHVGAAAVSSLDARPQGLRDGDSIQDFTATARASSARGDDAIECTAAAAAERARAAAAQRSRMLLPLGGMRV